MRIPVLTKRFIFYQFHLTIQKIRKDFKLLKTGLSILFWEEIDKERGVVLEEYRLGLGASKRMMGRYISKMMHDSKYATCLLVKKEVLKISSISLN
jgi:zinc protease